MKTLRIFLLRFGGRGPLRIRYGPHYRLAKLLHLTIAYGGEDAGGSWAHVWPRTTVEIVPDSYPDPE